MSRIGHFYLELTGVTLSNPDGTSRQKILKTCEPFEKLILEIEEYTRYDYNVIKVTRENGSQIGYIEEDVSEEICAMLKQGFTYHALIFRIIGGSLLKRARKVQILLILAEPDVTEKEVLNIS